MDTRVFGGAVLIVVVCAGLAMFLQSGTATPETYAQVEIGMTYNETVRLIGRPSETLAQTVTDDGIKEVLYRWNIRKGVTIVITFYDGKVYRKRKWGL